MKKIVIVFLVVLCHRSVHAQTQEAQQLMLNWEKLTQFKVMLRDMYNGWKLIDNGYKQIKDIASGNFNLHKEFLDALLQVSPVVRQYQKISDITRYQLLLLKQCKAASRKFESEDVLHPVELEHIGGVYRTLFKESLKNLDELTMVISSGQLRMTDEERLKIIDNIYERIMDQYNFLKDFNSSTAYLVLQRKSEQAETMLLKKLHGY